VSLEEVKVWGQFQYAAGAAKRQRHQSTPARSLDSRRLTEGLAIPRRLVDMLQARDGAEGVEGARGEGEDARGAEAARTMAYICERYGRYNVDP